MNRGKEQMRKGERTNEEITNKGVGKNKSGGGNAIPDVSQQT